MPATQSTPTAVSLPEDDIGLATLSPEGRITGSNERFAALLGRPGAVLTGQSVTELLSGFVPSLGPLLDGVLSGGAPAFEHELRPLTGEDRRLLLSLSPVYSRLGQILGFDLVLRPEGQRSGGVSPANLAMGEAGGRSVARASALFALTASLSRALTPERVAQAVLEAAGSLQITGGVVTLLEADQATLALLAMEGYPDEVRQIWRRFPLTLATPLSDAARRGEPVFLASREERDRQYPHLARDYPAMKARAWAALPLKLDTQLLGVLGLSFANTLSFDEDDRAYLMTMAGLCAQALERARLSAAERAALAAADEALAMLDRVIDSAPIGMAYLDRELRFRRVNPRMAALMGLSNAPQSGERAAELLSRAGLPWERYVRQVMESGEPVVDLELSAAAAEGGPRYALLNFYPVQVSGGAVLGVGVAALDITERKAAEEERSRLLAAAEAARGAAQEALARAEEALQLRDDFLSVAAHELKTPLTSLVGQAQLLERRLAKAGLLSGANERSLQVVVGQARRLSSLIGDLLDGARLHRGQLTLNLRPLDLGRLAQQIVNELQPTIPGHRLQVRVESSGPRVRGDAVRLDQVLQNLLGNAVKYSPRGSEVLVEVRRNGDRALLSVQDQGVGIPAEALPHLFERFYRVVRPETASISGVGVGLYVVREIVRLHGGEVWASSVLGEGSTFTVALPLADEE